MSGQILIVENSAAHRVILRALLDAARLSVVGLASLADAAKSLKDCPPDIVFLDTTSDTKGAVAFLRKLKASRKAHRPDVVAIIDDDPAQRIAALQAGAVDVMTRGGDEHLLLARVRRILRQREELADIETPLESMMPFGFAEPNVAVMRKARVVVLSARQRLMMPAMLDQISKQPQQYEMHQLTVNFPTANDDPPADLIVIDGYADPHSTTSPAHILRMMSELRSRSKLRHARQMIIVPPNSPDFAALTLDMGADDLVTDNIRSDELAHRIQYLIEQKQKQDTSRAHMQTGLEAAVRDPLTGLFNRRHAMPHLDALLAKATTQHQGFALLMVDIDHFKSVNDTHGHPVGDEILISVAERLRNGVRTDDMVARIGGEEFLIALSDTSGDPALAMAERLRGAISDLPFDVSLTGIGAPVEFNVTVSIGVAICDPPSAATRATVATLLKDADEALYLSKSQGRNTVSLAPV